MYDFYKTFYSGLYMNLRMCSEIFKATEKAIGNAQDSILPQ